MYTLYFIAPIVVGLCVDNFVTMQGDLCNFRQPSDVVLKYEKQDLKNSCYKDDIYYPNCEDLKNQQVLYYHNLLYKK
jgi:hypothetical protein